MNRFVLVGLISCLLSAGRGMASERLTAIVGDLHLDESGERGGQDEAFARLLAELHARSGGNADLILNGDTFELLGCDGGCSEGEAVSRLDRILDAHRTFAESLGAFSRPGTHRIVLVPGDQDVALLFPAVAARLRERLAGEMEVAASWTSDDGRIVAEHGHQLPGDPYRFEDWPRPFTADGRLQTSIGGRELEPIFARLEATFPVIRDFATRLAGLEYALSAETTETVSAALLKVFLLGVSWQQFRRDLEIGVQAPEWDLAATRSSGDDFLLESIPEDHPLHSLSRRALGVDRFAVTDLTDAEVRLVCDYRAAVRRARRRMERGLTQLARVGPVVAECPRGESSRDPSFSYYWRSRDAIFAERIEELSGGIHDSSRVYVHGHTHLADRGFVPGGEGEFPRILNMGAFKRVLTPVSFEASREAEGATIKRRLERLRLEELPACYSFVLVEPYERSPDPRLSYWSRLPEGVFRMSPRCEE